MATRATEEFGAGCCSDGAIPDVRLEGSAAMRRSYHFALRGTAHSVTCLLDAPIAQLVEQSLRKRWVGGSSPSWGTISHLPMLTPYRFER